jgi:hypothetical protein
MNTEKREAFRLALLSVLEANNTQYGLGLPALANFAAVFGFPNVPARDLEREILYLEDKQYVIQLFKPISPENRVWRITAQGRDYLAQLSPEE